MLDIWYILKYTKLIEERRQEGKEAVKKEEYTEELY